MTKEEFKIRFVPNYILDMDGLITYITELENKIKTLEDKR